LPNISRSNTMDILLGREYRCPSGKRWSFTKGGSWGNVSGIVPRQTGTRERENGQIVRYNAAWGG